MTKQLNLKLVLIILVSMMGMNAYSYDACIDGIYYNFNGDNAIVTHQHPTNSSNDYKGAVVIPSSVHYNSKDYSVTSIDEDECFLGLFKSYHYYHPQQCDEYW